MNNYLDSIREVERRIEKAALAVAENELPDLSRPTGVPASYAEHARLMFELQLLAMQGDVTRVITFHSSSLARSATAPIPRSVSAIPITRLLIGRTMDESKPAPSASG